jgi:hypothetical protein
MTIFGIIILKYALSTRSRVRLTVEVEDLFDALERRWFGKIAFAAGGDPALALQVDQHLGVFDPT